MSHLSFAADPADGRILTDTDMTQLLQDAAKKGNLQSLSLEGNVIQPAALRLLERFIIDHTQLNSLNVAMCGLHDDGALAIVRACVMQKKKPTSVKFLNLALNNITDRGCHAIGRFLRFSCPATSGVSLSSAVFSMNPLTGHGVLALVRGAMLRKLEVVYCSIQFPRDVDVVSQAIREDQRLHVLNIEGNHCTRSHASVLLDAIASNGKSRLAESALLWGKAAGELSHLETWVRKMYMQTIITTGGGGGTGSSPGMLLTRPTSPRSRPNEQKDAESGSPSSASSSPSSSTFIPRAVYEDYTLVYGASLIVRGRLRDVSKQTINTDSASRSASSMSKSAAAAGADNSVAGDTTGSNSDAPPSLRQRMLFVPVDRSAFQRVDACQRHQVRYLDATLESIQGASRHMQQQQPIAARRGIGQTGRRSASCTAAPAPGIGRVAERLRCESQEREQQREILAETLLENVFQVPVSEHEVSLRAARRSASCTSTARGRSQSATSPRSTSTSYQQQQTPMSRSDSSRLHLSQPNWVSNTRTDTSMTSVRSSSSAATTTATNATLGSRQPTTSESILSKGKALQLLLDRCLVSDEQCEVIFGTSKCFVWLKPAVADANKSTSVVSGGGGGVPIPLLQHAPPGSLPTKLQHVDATPSSINSLQIASEVRVLSIAKLLWLLMHAPERERRMPIERAAALSDLPPHVAASPLEAVAKYRSQRSVENNAARRLLSSLQSESKPIMPSVRDIKVHATPRIDSRRRGSSTTPRKSPLPARKTIR